MKRKPVRPSSVAQIFETVDGIPAVRLVCGEHGRLVTSDTVQTYAELEITYEDCQYEDALGDAWVDLTADADLDALTCDVCAGTEIYDTGYANWRDMGYPM